MNQFYYDAVTKMEQMGVDDGEEKNTDNFGNWKKG